MLHLEHATSYILHKNNILNGLKERITNMDESR